MLLDADADAAASFAAVAVASADFDAAAVSFAAAAAAAVFVVCYMHSTDFIMCMFGFTFVLLRITLILLKLLIINWLICLLLFVFLGRSLRRHLVKLVVLQKGAYVDLGREIAAAGVCCCSRIFACTCCDCSRRQINPMYLKAARVSNIYRWSCLYT